MSILRITVFSFHVGLLIQKFTFYLFFTQPRHNFFILPLEIIAFSISILPSPSFYRTTCELISFHSFKEKSSLVVLPWDGLRLRCAIGIRRPATCWLEGKSHLFKFSSRRSLRGEARSLGAPGAWLTSCVTSIMHVLRHRRALGVSPLPE